jgi:hypothetical protein
MSKPTDIRDDMEAGTRTENLCVLYGDHDECPVQEVDPDGHVVFCSCSCHLMPDA